jgi:biofilm PGA synthesis N-glycosyltransferase PgaC
MKLVFWLSVAVIMYTYAGYPVWLWLRSRSHTRTVQRAPICPTVSIVLAVHNEAQWLPAKLKNLAELDYPSCQREIIVVSDGSTDDTNQLLAAAMNESVHAVFAPLHEGKASALNQGIRESHGDIVVFTDARQIIEKDALRNLVSNFFDPNVGGVTGELFIESASDAKAPLEGVGFYWRIEKEIRKWESATGSVVGATGALYAVRRSLLVPLPTGTILDDVYTPLEIVRQGYRVVFEPQARAWDPLPVTSRQEFHRKIRTLTGNYQLLQLMPWLLSRANPLRFRFVSHKLLRLLVPFLLAAVLVSSILLTGNFYRIAEALQLVFYGLGFIVFLRPRIGSLVRPANFAFSFLLLNTAGVVAFANFLIGRKEVWVRSR